MFARLYHRNMDTYNSRARRIDRLKALVVMEELRFTPGQRAILQEIVLDKIDFLNTFANRNRYKFFFCRRALIILSALLPLVALIPSEFNEYKVIISGFLGVLISITTGLYSLSRYHENWLSYRLACEQIVAELDQYLALKAGESETNADENFRKFIQNIEGIDMAQVEQWKGIFKDGQLQSGKA